MQKPDIRAERGTAAQSGANDLAMIGALPAAFVAHPALAESATVSLDPVSAAPGENSSETARSEFSDGSVESDVPGFSLIPSPGMMEPLIAPSVAGLAVATDAVKSQPASEPTGSGGIAVYVPAQGASLDPDAIMAQVQGRAVDVPVPEAAPVLGATAALAADPGTSETIRSSVAAIQEVIGTLGGRMPSDGKVTDTISGDARDVLASALDTATALDGHLINIGNDVAAVTDRAEALVKIVGDRADDLVEGAGRTVAALDGRVSDLADTLHDGVTAQLGAISDGARDALENTTDNVTALIDDVADAVRDTMTGAVGHAAEITTSAPVQFAGFDPPAGITTLVGMVSAADAFNLHDSSDHGDSALAPALGAFGAADLLAEAHPADTLLGIVDHGLGSAGHGGFDHHDGLPGIG